MERVSVVIEGISPLLMHAYPLVSLEALEKRSPQEQAELAAYRDPDTGELYLPGVAVQRALIAGAGFSKGKGRASLAKVAAACLMVEPERIGLGVREYAIDARPVVVPATRGRVVRYRPRLDHWRAQFDILYDPLLLTPLQVRRIVDDTGSRVGLLDFRPERKGPFGRFQVVHWQVGDF